MAFDYEGAIKAGYTDSDIAGHLASRSDFDLDGALKAGYSHSDIINHLSKGNGKKTTPDINYLGLPTIELEPQKPQKSSETSGLLDKLRAITMPSLSGSAPQYEETDIFKQPVMVPDVSGLTTTNDFSAPLLRKLSTLTNPPFTPPPIPELRQGDPYAEDSGIVWDNIVPKFMRQTEGMNPDKAANITALHQHFKGKLPINFIADNYDAITQQAGLRGQPTPGELVGGMMAAAIATGLMTNPIATIAGVTGYMGMKEAESLGVQAAKGKLPKLFQGEELSQFLGPLKEPYATAVEGAEFFGPAAASGMAGRALKNKLAKIIMDRIAKNRVAEAEARAKAPKQIEAPPEGKGPGYAAEDIIDIEPIEPKGPEPTLPGSPAERLLIDLKEAKTRGRTNVAQPPEVIRQGLERPMLPPPIRRTEPTDVADFTPSEESAVVGGRGNFPVQQVNVKDIKTKPEELQFKLDVNAAGVQKPLEGDWNELAAGNLLLWQAKDGNIYVANGHHRLDLAKQKGIETVNAQVLREKDGFGINDARRVAAEANILEGKGTIYDQAEYFRLQPEAYTPDVARSRGLAGRGYTIGRLAAPDTYTQFRSREISPEAAESISAAAPGNSPLQAAGVKFFLRHPKSDQYEITNFIKALSTVNMKPSEQGDMFGWDDSAIVAAEKMGRAADKEIRDLRDKIAAVQGAARRPETAKSLGVDVKDPASVQAKITELKNQIDAWGRWETNPELVAELKKRTGLVEKEPPAETPTVIPSTPEIVELGATSGGKQPWEMTRAEYSKSVPKLGLSERMSPGETKKYKLASIIDGTLYEALPGETIHTSIDKRVIGDVAKHPELYDQHEVIGGFISPDGEFIAQSPRQYHGLQVRQALSEGKPVPPEVLKDYPDLQPTPKGEFKNAEIPGVTEKETFGLVNPETEIGTLKPKANMTPTGELFEPAPVYTLTENGLTKSPRRGYNKNQEDLFNVSNTAGRSNNTPAETSSLRGRQVSDDRGDVLSYTPESGTLPKVKSQPIGTWKSSRSEIKTPEDAAVIARDNLEREPQEVMISIVTGKHGNILAINQHTVGGTSGTSVFPNILAGQILNVPGAKQAWLVHNHPSGNAKLSNEDVKLGDVAADLLDGHKIEVMPIMVVTPSSFATAASTVSLPAKEPATHTFDVLGRKFAEIPKGLTSLTEEDDLARFGRTYLPDGGMVLVSSQNEPVAIIKIADFTKLRPSHLNILSEAERRNASGFMVYAPNKTLFERDFNNLHAFSRRTGMPFITALDRAGDHHANIEHRREHPDIFRDQATFTSGIDPTQTLKVLKGLKNNIQEAMPHLEALGRKAYEEGYKSSREWAARMKHYLKDTWDTFKKYLKDVWAKITKPLRNQRGAVGEKQSPYEASREELKKAADHPAKSADETLKNMKLKGSDPVLEFDALMRENRLIVDDYDGSGKFPTRQLTGIPNGIPELPDKDMNFAMWALSPSTIARQLFPLANNPVVESFMARMAYFKNRRNAVLYWRDALKDIPDNRKAMIKEIRPLFKENKKLLDAYAKLEAEKGTMNNRLRQIPRHEEYDRLVKEVGKLGTGLKKIRERIQWFGSEGAEAIFLRKKAQRMADFKKKVNELNQKEKQKGPSIIPGEVSAEKVKIFRLEGYQAAWEKMKRADFESHKLKWEALERKALRMINGRKAKMGAIEETFKRVPDYMELKAKIRIINAKQQAMNPAFEIMGEKYDELLTGMLQKYPDARVFHAANETLPPLVKLNPAEQRAVDMIKSYMESARKDLEDLGIPVIKTKAYMTHLVRDLIEDSDIQKAMSRFMTRLNRPPTLLRFMSRLPHSRPWLPSANAVGQVYPGMAEFKIAHQPFLDRWTPYIDALQKPNLKRYMEKWLKENLYASRDTWGNKIANAIVSFEYVRLIGGSLSVAFKHMFKQLGTFQVYGTPTALKGEVKTVQAAMQYFRNKIGIKGRTAEMRVYRSYVNMLSLVRAMDEVPTLRDAGKWLKLTTGQPTVLVEALDNGVSVFAGIIAGAKKGMPVETIRRQIWDTILLANFRSNLDQPLWQKNVLSRALSMFQMTPFKLSEKIGVQLVNALKNRRDNYGTHYGTMLLRILIAVGIAEAIARQNDTSIADISLSHTPFIKHWIAPKKGPPYFELKWPKITASPVVDWISKMAKEKDVIEGTKKHLTDWGIFTKAQKAADEKYSKKRYDSSTKFMLGLPKIESESEKYLRELKESRAKRTQERKKLMAGR